MAASPILTTANLRKFFFKKTNEMNKGNEFAFLDGMRGIAALLVFFYHLSIAGLFKIGPVEYFGGGTGGVTLFFILSSFLLTRIFIMRYVKSLNVGNYAKYMFRRFMRIYPLYLPYLLLALLSSFLMVAATGDNRGTPFYLSVTDFLQHVALLEGFGVTWTIVVEFQYYFLLPFIALGMQKLYEQSVFLLLGAFVIVTIACGFIWPTSEMIPENTFIGYHIIVFLLGSLMGCLSANGVLKGHRDISKRAQLIATVIGVASMVAFIAQLPMIPRWLGIEPYAVLGISPKRVAFAIFAAGIIYGCLAGHRYLRAPFEAKITRYFGAISFSLYLMHTVVISAFGVLGLDAYPQFAWILAFIATTIISHVTFSVFEVPASKVRPEDLGRFFPKRTA